MHLFLNYETNEEKQMYSFLNYQCFDINSREPELGFSPAGSKLSHHRKYNLHIKDRASECRSTLSMKCTSNNVLYNRGHECNSLWLVSLHSVITQI
jgi:hypothetical protein